MSAAATGEFRSVRNEEPPPAAGPGPETGERVRRVGNLAG
jgi:hypothetical protein